MGYAGVGVTCRGGTGYLEAGVARLCRGGVGFAFCFQFTFNLLQMTQT